MRRLERTLNGPQSFDLNQPVYSLTDAAAILAVSRSTLGWWLESGERSGHHYKPVIRVEATGDTRLTWPEFLEAGLLRQYRRNLQVRLHEIRSFVSALRDELGVAHPLAYAAPWVGEGRRLLVRFQERCDLRGELHLIAVVGGQPLLLPPADSFVKRVEWDDDRPVAWRPHADDASPVRCRPDKRFGRPAIAGISTTAIVEHLDGGETEIEVAEQFDLALENVRWAVAYETSRVAVHAA
ncbi:MAG: DUF433 domain-containing protein [Acidimicrobiales bacterium]|nr:DUF433 domain-containing protein [Acidimicrobiales bacterium]MYF08314.1 DUF433 domain-containing protein [Rhodospirillaceae bacterium]MYJ65206.1 DUF433 domain-containing protein [Acidimicrobiales bacterium]